jgi:hypothetical protein
LTVTVDGNQVYNYTATEIHYVSHYGHTEMNEKAKNISADADSSLGSI